MKDYYKISEISKLYGIGADSLRYYERAGIITPKRGENGYRLYGLKDIYKLSVLRDLMALDFSVAQAKEYLDGQNVGKTLALLRRESGILSERLRELAQKKELIEEIRKYPDVEVVAGVATGAIAHGMLIAHFLGKPFVYVRPKPKDHGTGSQIEGILEKGAKVVVVEDLISTGKSSLAAVDALNKASAEVLGMVAIFSYNFNQARRAFEVADVELTTLTNYDALIDVACQTGYIKDSDLELLREWRFSPSTWGKKE